ncbi:matrixin family metalloprotease [Bacillus thuringiensis]|uniref:matrixin family metalloprotease n=1 Tax=Bacillus thuringiensis TaxID=1428 RepID=UPI000BFA430F|nr:matrixin family metalloprotease [Bacillus thuringiensis]PFF59217.1 Tolloid-like protein 1 [Bacillus thuringiensis]
MTTNQSLNHCVQMNLPDDQIIEAARLAIQENPDNAPDTDEVSADSIDSFEMALEVRKKWRNGRTLRVRFLDGNPTFHEKVKRYANEWSRYANLKFAFGNDPEAEIRISFEQTGGYWSYVGTDNLAIPRNKATMNFEYFNSNTSDTEFSRVVLHEFGHCIGVSHEQSNPAANIPWDKEAVYRYYARGRDPWSPEMVDLQVLAKLDPRGAAFTPHDTQSIMQYPVPNELTIGDYEIDWNNTLSEIDKRFIGQMYPF